MKTYFKLLFVVGMLAFLFSCTTSQTVTISGTPGTDIYTLGKTKLATIDHTGKTKIKFPSGGYYGLLLTYNKAHDKFIPFALDHKKKNYWGSRIRHGAGISLMGAGFVPMLAGTIAYCAGDEESGTPLVGVGTATMLVGAGMAGIGGSRVGQTQHQYRFTYLKNHSTNDDLSFIPIEDNGYTKSPTKPEEVVVPVVDSQSTSSRTIKTVPESSKSKRSLNNFGKTVSGAYKGEGTLHHGNEFIESYENIEIEITRIDNNNVQVNVIEGGTPFFNSVSSYSIKKEKQNSYTLTLQGNSSATIKIDSKGKLTYYHPKVNIDGDNYILKISAKKN